MTYAVQDVWDSFSQPLRRFITRRIADPQDVEDVLQDVFIKVHTRIDTLHSEDRVAAWLYQIARNTIADYYRARKLDTVVLDEALAEQDDGLADPYAELSIGLEEMIASLPEKYQVALEMSELQGLKQQDVAARLGISLSGAKSRVQRGRLLLREELLDCCHFEFDRLGRLVDYTPRPECCERCRS